jgi:hypothetical protein
MKQVINQATQKQLSSRGGDVGEKKRMNSRVLTVCFTMGKTHMIEIRDYKGGDYEQGKHIDQYAGGYVVCKDGKFKFNQFNQ